MTLADILRGVFALGFTLALIGLCAWAVQKFSRGRFALRDSKTPSRLAVVEWKALDGRHQLFLIRRDQTEHLIVVGPQGQPVVIETNITPPPPAQTPNSSGVKIES